VIWSTSNLKETVSEYQKERPDLIFIDLSLIFAQGLEIITQIMTIKPCAIIVTIPNSKECTPIVFKAMGSGALDVLEIPPPPNNEEMITETLKNKLLVISRLVGKSTNEYENEHKKTLPQLLLIGASTGGPVAISKIISQLPKSFPAAVVVIQHVDTKFTVGFANWLGENSELPVLIAKQGWVPEQGKVYVAGSNDHLIISDKLVFEYTDQPLTNLYRPSVDVCFESVAKNWPKKAIAVLLTGMGADGAKGLKALKDKGWYTIAQDETSSIVFGMPKEAIKLKAAKDVFQIDLIPSAILNYFSAKIDKVKP
jgi:two-component system response regulator WspF